MIFSPLLLYILSLIKTEKRFLMVVDVYIEFLLIGTIQDNIL